MSKTPPRTNDGLLFTQLSPLVRVPPPPGGTSFQQWLYTLDSPTAHLALPFTWNRVRPLYEKIAVLSAVLMPGSKELLHAALDETPDDILLCSDGFITDRKGLFLVMIADHHTRPAAWLNAMREPFITVRRRPRSEDLIIAAPVWAFTGA